jgi:hypothetical protein
MTSVSDIQARARSARRRLAASLAAPIVVGSALATAPARAQSPAGVWTQQGPSTNTVLSALPLSSFQSSLSFGSTSVTATGGTTARTLSARAADTVNVTDYGAVPDMMTMAQANYTIAAGGTALSASGNVFNPSMAGKTLVLPGAGANGAGLVSVISQVTDGQHVTLATAATTALAAVGEAPEVGTDNTAAINAAVAAAYNRRGPLNVDVGSVYFPDGYYMVQTLNFTNMTTASFKIFGDGVVHGVNAGHPVVDALGSRWMRWEGVHILGDQYSEPSAGLQIGRTANTANNSSDNNSYSHFMIAGWYSVASLLNEQSETSEFDKLHIYNNDAKGIAVAMDGYDHFAAASPYVTNNEPVDQPESFDENVFTNCIFSAYLPLWLGSTSRVKVVSGYGYASGPYGVVLYNETSGGGNIQPDLDLHIEGGAMTDVFAFEGNATGPTMEGFRWREHGTQATNSVFKIDPSAAATAIYLPNIDLDVYLYANGASKLFDNPAPYTVSGRVYVPNASYMNVTNYSGLLVTPYGTTDTSAVAPSSLQPALVGDGFSFGNAVAAASITNGGTYYVIGTAYTPTVTFAAAPAGGTTATGHVSALYVFGKGGLGAGGTGYTVANNVPVTDGNGNTIYTANITAVGTGGAITKLTFNGNSNPVTTVPATLQIVQSGASGGTVTGANFTVNAVAIDNPGAGYTSGPALTFSTQGAAPVATGTGLLALRINAPTNVNSAPVTTQSGAYTFAASDCGSTVEYTGTANTTWTVPAGLAIGCRIDVVQKSSGTITFAGANNIAPAEYLASGTKNYATNGTAAQARVLIDTASSFLLSGQVN